MAENLSNWAGNYTYQAARLHYPETTEQLQSLVRKSTKVKVLGSRHSFNDIADTPGDLMSLDRLPTTFLLDRERNEVTVAAHARYGQICEHINSEGFALHNMASLPHITVAGSCATGTHGSGDRNGNLATAVSAIEFVAADGSIHTLRRGASEHFSGAVVALGGLGIWTKVTLALVPAFNMRQNLYRNLPVGEMEEHFDEITSSAYSVSFFTDWQTEQVNQLWLIQRVNSEQGDRPNRLDPVTLGATPATTRLHPIESVSAEACTEQLGIPGPWYDRLPHFRMGFTPSTGEELQTEYIVPRKHAIAAMRVMMGLRERIGPLLQISEVRTIAADDLWMSPSYGQDSVGIHFTWVKDWPGVRQLLPVIEQGLEPLGARPHWGKLFAMSAAKVQSLYPRLTDFQKLLQTYDPQGKFRNTFLDTYIFQT